MNRFERAFQGFLYCRNYQRTWAFPPEVARILLAESVEAGKRTLQLYGGMAGFGVRLDMDPATAPHVLGNALYPPFRCKSFDVVIVDPPFEKLNGTAATNIIAPAACLARERVWWMHTSWPGCGAYLRILRWWAVCPCSRGSPLRILAEFQAVRHPEYCVAVPGKQRRKLRPEFRKYDWSRFVGTPPAHGEWAVQLRLI